MNDAVRMTLAIVVPVAFLAAYVAMHVRLARRARNLRQWYRDHPEQFPSRRSRILRVLPFGILVLVITVWYAMSGRTEMLPLGVIGVGCFAFAIYRIASGREDLRGE